MSEELPRFVKDLLASPPTAGEGIHKWMFSTARYLHAFRSADEIAEIFRATLHGAGRRIPDREMQAAIADAKKAAWVAGQKNEIVYQSAWPKLDKVKYTEITCKGLGAYDLWEISPYRFMDDKSYSNVIIEALFSGNPYLCCGLTNAIFESKKKQDWMRIKAGGLRFQQFIVPSPCIGEYGLTKDGKESAHCLNNTGPREYQVIEMDQGSADQQCAVIEYLTKYMPLRMVLSSGGKSLHAWYDVKGKDEDKQLEFMKVAVSLGADPATWVRSQFVRMPDGLRDNSKRQSVFYFNP